MKKKMSREECRKIMVDILTEIDAVCRKNDIPYYLGGGTLLGAIRHHGFIPWDDDIDIFLSRKDYNRLLLLLKSEGLPSWLDVIDEHTTGYYLPFAKAVDNRTIVKKKASVIWHGIWVDVFPMEDVPDDPSKRTRFLKTCQILRSIIISMVTDFSTQKCSVKTMYKFLMNFIANCIGKKRVLQISERYMQRYNPYKTNTMCITWSPYGTEYMEKDAMNEIIDLEFEGKLFKGPKAYDVLLTRAFGDYMTLPPEEKRKNHEVVAWWKD